MFRQSHDIDGVRVGSGVVYREDRDAAVGLAPAARPRSLLNFIILHLVLLFAIVFLILISIKQNFKNKKKKLEPIEEEEEEEEIVAPSALTVSYDCVCKKGENKSFLRVGTRNYCKYNGSSGIRPKNFFDGLFYDVYPSVCNYDEHLIALQELRVAEECWNESGTEIVKGNDDVKLFSAQNQTHDFYMKKSYWFKNIKQIHSYGIAVNKNIGWALQSVKFIPLSSAAKPEDEQNGAVKLTFLDNLEQIRMLVYSVHGRWDDALGYANPANEKFVRSLLDDIVDTAAATKSVNREMRTCGLIFGDFNLSYTTLSKTVADFEKNRINDSTNQEETDISWAFEMERGPKLTTFYDTGGYGDPDHFVFASPKEAEFGFVQQPKIILPKCDLFATSRNRRSFLVDAKINVPVQDKKNPNFVLTHKSILRST